MQLPIPIDIQPTIAETLQLKFSQKVILHSFSFTLGGCINSAGKLETSVGNFFLKWNDLKKFPGMFDAEAKGLRLLKSADAIYVPDIIGHSACQINQFILLEFINATTPTKNYWTKFAYQLAELHKNTNTFFGLDHENYIGSLNQRNTQKKSWIEFFVEERLTVQMKLAVDSQRIDVSLLKKLEIIYKKLPTLFPEEKPSLIHGDLWQGNILNENGKPCVIDPAVSYSHREAELAFTRLFGGFDESFYAAYDEGYSIQPGFENRVDLYNLYPLLVHVNLFGGAYTRQVMHIVNSFL